jgi:glycosyltransferase involved in cell wall biosynthesis
LKVIEVRTAGSRRASLHAWEQLFLPAYTATRTLLNLAGPAPLLKRRQVCMIADAAIFDFPNAYTPLYGAWYRLLFRSVSRLALGLLTISQFSRTQLIKAIGASAERLKIIDCAATHMATITPDDSVLDRLHLRQTRFLLAVGSLNPTKNLAALVKAFNALEDPTLRLVLVGGSNTSVFAGEAETLPADARTIPTGSIGDGELSSLYRNAEAFVFPSLYEGFGIPPLEAMSLGCPVAAARAASIPEICADAAYYFDPSNVSDITHALRTVLADEALRVRLRDFGIRRSKHFTWERGARQLYVHLTTTGIIRDAAVETSPLVDR